MKPESFAGSTPALEFEKYFAGETKGYGIIFTRGGEVRRQFVVEMHGKQNDDVFTLDEYFTFLDGERLTRQWNVRRLDEHNYDATASDDVRAGQGRQFGSVVRWSYVLQVPVKGSTYNITMDDWMYLQEDGVMINRTKMSKFGIGVGEMVITFRKPASS